MVKTRQKSLCTVMSVLIIALSFLAVLGNVSMTTASAAAGDVIYCKNAAGWTDVYCYAWGGTSGAAKGWPGEKMTLVEGNIYSYTLPGDQKLCIFNIGSNQKQTGDLTIPASANGAMYDNQAGSWSVYDTSAVRFQSFGTDLASPQFKDIAITINATATSTNGGIQYRFSVNLSTGTDTALKEFSTDSSVVWTPTVAGVYTVKIEAKDSKGETSKREFEYTIKDDATSTKPVLKGVAPKNNGEILYNKDNTLTANASGGKTGTNLLFYKWEIKNSAGTLVNTPYYTLSPSFTFKPTQKGEYKVTLTVQASDNSTDSATYTFTSVDNYTQAGDPTITSFTQSPSGMATVGSSVSLSAAAGNGTAPYTYQFLANGAEIRAYSSSGTCTWTPTAAGTYTLTVNVKDANNKTATRTATFTVSPVGSYAKGDCNRDGAVSLKDATLIQKVLASMASFDEEQQALADFNGDGSVSLKDATAIQKFLAGL